VLCVDVNYEWTLSVEILHRRRSPLTVELSCVANVPLQVHVKYGLRKSYAFPSTRTSPVHAVWPVSQNCGQSPFKAVPSPCGSHVDRYGDRTASGIDGGLNGMLVQVTPEATAVETSGASVTISHGEETIVVNVCLRPSCPAFMVPGLLLRVVRYRVSRSSACR
jgi:hypothetical protein